MSPHELLSSLRLPIMQAPMSIASSRELVTAASLAGVIGCFPTHNARRGGGLAHWVDRIRADLDASIAAGGRPAPFAININMSSRRVPEEFAEDLAVCRAVRAPIVTTNAGDPRRVLDDVHGWGGLVIHDATTLQHAERAIAAGVDGLMLVCAGAGGLGGQLSPFTFLRRVRAMFDGLIVLAGGIADGRGVAAAQMLGADLVCMGTRFIATREAGAPEGHKAMLVDTDIADVLWTDAICGVDANFLRPSVEANGLDPARLPPLSASGRPGIPREIKPWSMVWSGGHSTALVDDVPTVATLVDRLEREYREARSHAPHLTAA
ncbi:MAG TPA: nitronate monooxygenase [Caulobacteraceae bacterium]|nr:nitronate monooxygenase [Caulobacteraceae bacterium]